MNGRQNSNLARAKTHIQLLLEQLEQDFKAAKDERRQLAIWEDTQDTSVLGVIELYTTDIRGCTAQVLEQTFLDEPQRMISHLKELQLFEVSYLADWYFTTQKFPKIKQYIDDLDYLRLLTVEYLNKHHINTPTAA